MILIHELNKEAHRIYQMDKCRQCGEKFILNSHIVDAGMFLFHLTCFKKYSEGKIYEHECEIGLIRSDINKLQPYAKDMICETLLKEKYG